MSNDKIPSTNQAQNPNDQCQMKKSYFYYYVLYWIELVVFINFTTIIINQEGDTSSLRPWERDEFGIWI